MPITDQTAVKFSDKYIRVSADNIAQAYYLAKLVSQRWTALGGGQSAIDVMESDIRLTADKIVSLYQLSFLSEKLWFLGVNSTMSSNDSTVVVDGSPDDTRPANTTLACNAVMTRCIQFQNWLLSSDGSFTNAGRDSVAYFNTVGLVSTGGPVVMTVGNAGNFINRCNELIANYEANSNANLNSVLLLSVNPNI